MIVILSSLFPHFLFLARSSSFLVFFPSFLSSFTFLVLSFSLHSTRTFFFNCSLIFLMLPFFSLSSSRFPTFLSFLSTYFFSLPQFLSCFSFIFLLFIISVCYSYLSNPIYCLIYCRSFSLHSSFIHPSRYFAITLLLSLLLFYINLLHCSLLSPSFLCLY